MVLLSYCKGSGGETVDSAAPCPINPFEVCDLLCYRSALFGPHSSDRRCIAVRLWLSRSERELCHSKDICAHQATRKLDPPARSLILLSGRPSVRHHPSPQSVLRHHRVLGLPHRYLSRHHAIRRRLRQCGGSTKGHCPRSRLWLHLRWHGLLWRSRHHRAANRHSHRHLRPHLHAVVGHARSLHALGEDVLWWLWKRVSAHFIPMPKSSSALISLSVSAVLQPAPKSEQMRPHRPGWLRRVSEFRLSTQ